MSRLSAGRLALTVVGNDGEWHPFDFKFVGTQVSPVGGDQILGRTNMLVGRSATAWRTALPGFREVVYPGMYPGIDVTFHASAAGLKYTLRVAPSAALSQFEMAIERVDAISIDASGNAAIEWGGGVVMDRAPFAVQGGNRVSCAFTQPSASSLGLDCPGRDPALPIVVDPLLYSTYLGGSAWDTVSTLALGSNGDVYLAGQMPSPDFPNGSVPPGGTIVGSRHAFVARLNGTTGALDFATFFGGSSTDTAAGIAVDGAGAAYIVGATQSPDFPTTASAFDKMLNGNATGLDAFLVKLDPTGASFTYSTYLGGSGNDNAAAVAVDANGSAYVSGGTNSADFPNGSSGFGSFVNLNGEAFVAKFAPTGDALVYRALVGGFGPDFATSVRVDSSGRAFVAGQTQSADFPVTPGAYNTSYAVSFENQGDAFVAEIDATGTGLVFATYLGGHKEDLISAMDIGPSGGIFVAGGTWSTDFPTTQGAFQPTVATGSESAFVTELSSDGASVIQSTYLGSFLDDRANALAVNATGYAFVVGRTQWSNFPTTFGSFDRAYHGPGIGGDDAFLAVLSPAGDELFYGTFLGGDGYDEAFGVGLAADGSVWVAGTTNSTDFPTVAGGPQTGLAGSADAFLTRISFPAPDFYMDLSASAPTARAPGGFSITAGVGRVSGYAGPSVNVSLDAPPPGFTSTCTPNPVAVGNNCSLAVSLDASVAPGVYPLNVTGDNGSALRAATFNLTVLLPLPPPDFAVGVSPTAIVSLANTTVEVNITVRAAAGYAGPPFGISMGLAPPGFAGFCTPASVIPNGSCAFSLIVAPGVTPGNYDVELRGDNGTVNRTTTLQVTVVAPPPEPGDFAVSVDPQNVTVTRDASVTFTVRVQGFGAYRGSSIAVSLVGAPSGVFATCFPGVVAVNASCLMTLQVGPAVAEGTILLTVAGSNGSAVRSAVLNLTVIPSPAAPDFFMELVPTLVKVTQGASAQVVVNITGSATYLGPPVAVVAQGLPSGILARCFPSSAAVPGNCTLQVEASAATGPGSYVVLVVGDNGTASRFANLSITVEAASPAPPPTEPGPITLALSRSYVSASSQRPAVLQVRVEQAQEGSATNVSVALGSPVAGIRGACDPAYVAPPANCTLTVFVDPSVPTGTYDLVVEGRNGTQAGAANLTLVVEGVPAGAGAKAWLVAGGILGATVAGSVWVFVRRRPGKRG